MTEGAVFCNVGEIIVSLLTVSCAVGGAMVVLVSSRSVVDGNGYKYNVISGYGTES